jgi:hypothetical protein
MTLPKLRSFSRTRISEAKSGELVKVVGRVRLLDAPLSAPTSGRPCALFHKVVIDPAAPARRDVVSDDLQVRDFLVDDDSGSALVRVTAGAKLSVRWADRRSDTSPSDRPAFDVYESVLEEGHPVAVLGLALWEPDPSPDARSPLSYREMPMRLVLIPMGDAPLVVSDERGSFR